MSRAAATIATATEALRASQLPPGPPLTALPWVLSGLRRDPLGFLTSLTRRYGDVVRLRFWAVNIYVVWQPEHVKHVLQDRHTIYTKDSTTAS